MTEEQRKWYLAGANDMEAGKLVTKPLESRTTNRYLPPRTPVLTADDVAALDTILRTNHPYSGTKACHDLLMKLRAIKLANGENDD